MYIDAKKNIYLDLVVIDIFSFEIIYVRKNTFEFLTFDI